MSDEPTQSRRFLRVLVVCPSWVGDVVMATPALRLIRDSMPGVFLGALVRPGIDQVLSGTTFFDEIHVDRAAGVMGPKMAGAKIRPRKYDAALLFSNSLRTALVTRIAGIPRRIGYARDGRGVLLTDRLTAPQRDDDAPGSGKWAIVPACMYYWHAAQYLCDVAANNSSKTDTLRNVNTVLQADTPLPAHARIELGTTDEDESAANEVLRSAGVEPDDTYVILNPGGNNEAKRWPADRFAAIGSYIHDTFGLRVLVSGAPNERELCDAIAQQVGDGAVSLPAHGLTLGSLKSIIRRSELMLTNDTGPRHMAAAFDVPLISLFGPTDHRWTTIPAPAGERIIVADPTLDPKESSNDHPDRCAIDRITVEAVRDEVGEMLATRLAN
ncbi:MAG: glycosyltransferase family 9 protein [Phycisphaeraceae bacterium]|nr:glycosyltransferase family 9 protein [Phycisphaerales bacterium]MCB9861322.1 glycosyltransferase family 9 protein [Phycisphaeraceae bacterium]